MATLLMVESWLHSTGLSLPPLIRDLGHHYVLLTRDPQLYAPTHPVIRNADEIVVADTNDFEEAVATAHVLSRRRRIDGVLTTCDYYLEATAVIAEALDLPGPSPAAMRLATRKHWVRRALNQAGITEPAYAVSDSALSARKDAAQIGYPLIAKPVDLNSGTSVRRIDNETELNTIYDQITGIERNTRNQALERLLLLEERLEGPEISVEAVTRNGQTTILGSTAKTIRSQPAPDIAGFIETGHTFPAPLDNLTNSRISALVRRALEAIDYRHGLSHTEVKLTANGPRIVEINPRQAGGFIFDLVHLVTGIHPLAALIDLALDRPPRATATTAVNSAAVSFVMSPVTGVLRGIDGTQHLEANPYVVRWDIRETGAVTTPADNNARLGHILTTDHGDHARARADSLLANLRLDIDEVGHVAPLM